MSGAEHPVLSLAGVSISFPAAGDVEQGHRRRTVVDDVSLEVGAGRIVALVGESSSGKSVTAMSTLGLLPSAATVTGSIRLCGEELVGTDAAPLRRVRGAKIGAVFQEPMSALNPVHTIGWQIAEAITAHGQRLTRVDVRRRVQELLRSVSVPDPDRVARAHPHELSGGQLQRAMIAMAIACDPVLLVADEPTTALDVTVQAEILELLRALRDERGMSVLLITHDMGVVADVADDVVVMHQGRIVERATATDLFAAPTAEYTRALLDAVPSLPPLRTDGPHLAASRRAPVPQERAVVRVRDVRITYRQRGFGRREHTAVTDASFTIAPGRTLALVGESGSGKSTLGRALAALVPIESGTIQVGETDISAASPRVLREARCQIGYVFQDPASSLNPRHSVGRSIAEPLRVRGHHTARTYRDRVTELLDAVRLPRDAAERFPHELSGGQRQRVAIARALALTPTLLIADEPTSALDVSVQATVLELLASLQDELGFACLFITHDLAVVAELAHEVAVLKRGLIVEQGRAGDVLTCPASFYTRRLLAAAPVASPAEQRRRRQARLDLEQGTADHRTREDAA